MLSEHPFMDSLLYYCKFTKSLTSIGFEINPYYLCVANNVIAKNVVNKSHMTTCSHVDNCKPSHHECKANDCMIKWLRQEYKIIFEYWSGKMQVSQVKVHEFLLMTLDYIVRVQVSIMMFSYIENIRTAFDKEDQKGKGTKFKRRSKKCFCGKRGLQENRAGESCGVPQYSDKDFVCY